MIVVETRVSYTNPIIIQFYKWILWERFTHVHFVLASFSFWSAGVASSRTLLFSKQKISNAVAEILLSMLNVYKSDVHRELDN